MGVRSGFPSEWRKTYQSTQTGAHLGNQPLASVRLYPFPTARIQSVPTNVHLISVSDCLVSLKGLWVLTAFAILVALGQRKGITEALALLRIFLESEKLRVRTLFPGLIRRGFCFLGKM